MEQIYYWFDGWIHTCLRTEEQVQRSAPQQKGYIYFFATKEEMGR